MKWFNKIWQTKIKTINVFLIDMTQQVYWKKNNSILFTLLA